MPDGADDVDARRTASTATPDDESNHEPAASRSSGQPMLARLLGRQPRTHADPELRDLVRTLDDTERKWTFGAAGVSGLLALLLASHLSGKTIAWTNSTYHKGDVCTKIVKGTCELRTITYPADYLGPFIALLVIAVVLGYAAYARKRSLAAFAAILVGLAASYVAGIIGVLLLIFGGWLVVRGWRLSRYGTSSAKEVRKLAIERSAQRKAARKSGAPPRDVAEGGAAT